MSDSLWCCGLQHTRLPRLSLSPRVCLYSGPMDWWCYLTVSHPATPSPFAFNPSQHQGLFQWFSSCHQVAKVLEPSTSTLPMNIQGWFPLELTGLISLPSKGLSRVLSCGPSSTAIWKHHFFGAQPSLWSNSCICT